MFARITLLFLILSLSACVSKPDPSPVVERPLNRYSAGENRLAQDALGSKVYIVQSGDTLYSIALRHGLDVRQLAEINNISNPGELRIGQELYLQTSFPSNLAVQQEDPSSQPTLYSISQPEAVSVAGYQPDILEHEREISESVKVEPKGILLPYSDSARNQLSRHTEVAAVQQATAEKPSGDGSVQPISVNVNKGGINWGWPVEGQIVSNFSEKSKGVGIGGNLKQPVSASASGIVVYSGNGLRGYGNLIIIKHNDNYLSAYGHNSKILVHEGEKVSKGQKIAEMGSTDGGVVKLHFEIREKGKPVNPLGYLPAR